MIPSIYQHAYKTNGISIILECQIDVINNNSMLAMPFQYETEPYWDLVLHDQKVLPDVTKLPLLPRVFFSHQTYGNTFSNTYRMISRITS